MRAELWVRRNRCDGTRIFRDRRDRRRIGGPQSPNGIAIAPATIRPPMIGCGSLSTARASELDNAPSVSAVARARSAVQSHCARNFGVRVVGVGFIYRL